MISQRPLTTGCFKIHPKSTADLLRALAGWLGALKEGHASNRFLEHAEDLERLTREREVQTQVARETIDRFVDYWRMLVAAKKETDPRILDVAADAGEKALAMTPEIRRVWGIANGRGRFKNSGFGRFHLALFRFYEVHQKEVDAIRVARAALQYEWASPDPVAWEKRILRCERRLMRRDLRG